MFRISWCRETNRFLGLCDLWPLVSYPADSAEEAMDGIRRLVAGYDLDNRDTDVEVVDPFDDTGVDGCVSDPIFDDGSTDTRWPPFDVFVDLE